MKILFNMLLAEVYASFMALETLTQFSVLVGFALTITLIPLIAVYIKDAKKAKSNKKPKTVIPAVATEKSEREETMDTVKDMLGAIQQPQ